MNEWMLAFEDDPPDDWNLRDELGGKGLGLKRMANAGLPVPPGFTIRAELGRRISASNGHWPTDAIDELERSLKQLEATTNCHLGKSDRRLVVSVRSGSATSMPGMMRTLLHCGASGESFRHVADEIKQAVDEVFRSFHSDQARQYRLRKNIDHSIGTAVTVQQMFIADAAGVLFTSDPMNTAGDDMLIEVVRGGGEALVSGDVTPRRLAIPRTGHISAGVVFDDFVISSNDLQTLRSLALKAEDLLQQSADIEWAIAGSEIALLQMRPIRSLPKQPPAAPAEASIANDEISRLRAIAAKQSPHEEKLWVAHNLQESVELPTEMTWSILSHFMSAEGALGDLYRQFGFRPPNTDPPHTFLIRIAGRIYADADELAAFFWNGLPLAYDGDALRENPAAIEGSPTSFRPDNADGSFLWNLPVNGLAMLHMHRRISRCIRDGVSSPWVTELTSLASIGATFEKHNAVDLSKLNNDELNRELNRLHAAACQTLQISLAPGFLGGFMFARLQEKLRLAFCATEAETLIADLLSGLSAGDNQREMALWRLAHDELTHDDFLQQFGHHCHEEVELANPRWSEAPTALLSATQLMQRLEESPEQRQRQASLRREQAMNSLADRLQQAGASTLTDEILQLAKLTQLLLPFRESGKHEWLRVYACLRRAIVEKGRRFDLHDDIFHLTFEELTSGGESQNELSQRVSFRRQRRASLAELQPARVISSKSPERAFQPANISNMRGSQQLTGFALSPGVGQGKALVIAKLGDFTDELAEPFVLVCPSTDPGWTPLMANAKALIVERGGLLSHGALIAREFGLPAIRLEDALRLIPPGAEVQVNASTATVIITP